MEQLVGWVGNPQVGVLEGGESSGRCLRFMKMSEWMLSNGASVIQHHIGFYTSTDPIFSRTQLNNPTSVLLWWHLTTVTTFTLTFPSFLHIDVLCRTVPPEHQRMSGLRLGLSHPPTPVATQLTKTLHDLSSVPVCLSYIYALMEFLTRICMWANHPPELRYPCWWSASFLHFTFILIHHYSNMVIFMKEYINIQYIKFS